MTPSSASSTGFAGSGSTGTRDRKWAGRSDLITSRSEPRVITGRRTGCSLRATFTATTAPTASAPPPRTRPSATNAPIDFAATSSTASEAAQFEAEGRPFALRFEVPPRRTLVLHDLIKGDVEFATDEIGDFVIVRPDGTPLYNFASVVDDDAMQITHVVRADEHLSNTFPQLLLFEALGASLPAFAHVPYVAEPGSKSKMSKRKLAEYEKLGILVYIHQYMEKGYLPDALLNYLSQAGLELRRHAGDLHASGADREILTRSGQQLSRQPRPGQAVLDRERVDEDTPARKKGAGRAPLFDSRGLSRVNRCRRRTEDGSKR